jgi:glycosyltransferase involved in cell wall biosynthesis
MSPRVIIGVPVYGKAGYLESAVRSLLAQTFADFRLYLIDDRSPDDSAAIARRLAAEDPRVEVHVNAERLGMLGNTRRAFELPRARHPEAEFWALGSDHDLWHPEFLARLVARLDAHPEAVLAYPLPERIDEHGVPYPGAKTPRAFHTLGAADPLARMGAAFRGMSAGNMIYGLFRAAALDRVGTYRPVLVPDRLMLSELALRGAFVVEPEVLWQRRFRGLAELDRQRRAFFLDDVPRYATLPWWAQHAGALALAYGVQGAGSDLGIGRRGGLELSARYLWLSLEHRARRRRIRAARRIRRLVRRYGPYGMARAAIRLLGRHGPAVGARGRRALDRLEAGPAAPVARRARPVFERVADRASGR